MDAAKRNTESSAAAEAGEQQPPQFEDVIVAARRIAPHANRTPLLNRPTLDELLGCELHYKCENLQRVGAFKFRGACNAVFSLDDEQATRGVATHSSGNHGAALALAAQQRGIPAWVVMPEGAVQVKVRGVQAYGGQVRFCEPTMAGREAMLAEVLEETGATSVHPYNDPAIIAGQGTAALEMLDERPDLDILLTPIGGGGLLSGTCIAGKGLKPGLSVFGAEPEGADDAWQSLQRGERVLDQEPNTIADGLRATIGPLAFSVLKQQVDDILRVNEDEIIAAMRLFWERTKLVIEPSCAVVIAALRRYPQLFEGRKVGAVMTGGNVDLDQLPWQ